LVKLRTTNDNNWTSGSISKTRKRGLMIRAEKNHRSYGQELENILIKAGIPAMTEKEFDKEMAVIKEQANK
jgi:hypothetical protein